MPHEFIRVDMPAIYSQADADWIQEQLGQLPVAVRQKAIVRYAEVFQQAFDTEPLSYKQENVGRHEANTRLRKFVKGHGRALQGYTTQPPLAGSR